MKKTFLAFAVVALLAVVAASCTHHTCPAYRGSTSMVEQPVDLQQA